MKPRLLDLFCGAGGCTKGYQRAGFYVVGIDIEPQPNYVGDEFHQGDALAVLSEQVARAEAGVGQWFDAIHASPPCQGYSRNMRHLSAPQPMLIAVVRDRLKQIGLPWVIENVEGSSLPNQPDLMGRQGIVLCGSSFGMRTHRHRWFETSFPVPPALSCNHRYRALNPHNQAGRDAIYEEFGRGDPECIWRKDLGVEWMGRYEAREAIPPKFTEYIGHHLMLVLQGQGAAA